MFVRFRWRGRWTVTASPASWFTGVADVAMRMSRSSTSTSRRRAASPASSGRPGEPGFCAHLDWPTPLGPIRTPLAARGGSRGHERFPGARRSAGASPVEVAGRCERARCARPAAAVPGYGAGVPVPPRRSALQARAGRRISGSGPPSVKMQGPGPVATTGHRHGHPPPSAGRSRRGHGSDGDIPLWRGG